MCKTEYHRLLDKSSTGRVNPWASKKGKSLLVAESFKRLGDEKRADRISSCGNFLEFAQYEDGSKKLHRAYLCHDRLCPLCAWRRSLKIYHQVSQVMDLLELQNQYQYIFLTLTVRNVCGEDLPEAITGLLEGFKTLQKTSRYKSAIKGAYRALEVTRNDQDESYHPHIHAILAVNRSYFNHEYIMQSEWTDLWKRSVRSDYQPIVYVEKVKGSDMKKAVAEIAKYTVKDSDLILPDYMTGHLVEDMQDEIIDTYSIALRKRRLISYSGVFRSAAKELQLDDPLEGDLVKVGDDDIRQDLAYVLVMYRWHVGLGDYVET